jgi:hypothetical protein
MWKKCQFPEDLTMACPDIFSFMGAEPGSRRARKSSTARAPRDGHLVREVAGVLTLFDIHGRLNVSNIELDDGWPESVEEQSLLLLVWRHYITR